MTEEELYYIREGVRKARKLKWVEEKKNIRIRETVNALIQIEEKGFVFTNNTKVIAEVVGYLKANGIPYVYIDGGSDWKYAIRRLDRMKDGG